MKIVNWVIALAFVALVSAIFYGVYSEGISSGKAEIQREWDKEKIAHKEQIDKLKDQIAKDQLVHIETTTRINDELAKAKNDYDLALSEQRAGFAKRLLLSAGRESAYKRQAQGTEAERDNLASHAARLDQSLEEGRSLVAELRDTLRLRERQLIELGNQLLADRKLLNE